MKLNKTDKEGVFKNIFIAYFILLFHVVLLAGIAVFVVLIKGVFEYLPWIMTGAGLLVALCVWLVIRQMRKKSAQIQDILSNEQLRNRNVEISFMGGLASFKVQSNAEDTRRLLTYPEPDNLPPDTRLIETDTDKAERKMNQLNALYEKDLITKEEFDQARQSIIQG
ncbi:MAG: SHOCT domain-containing protein [Desulfotignum sp.]|nr:SHOCT domain-containing protein [Desulfotignum sp.]